MPYFNDEDKRKEDQEGQVVLSNGLGGSQPQAGMAQGSQHPNTKSGFQNLDNYLVSNNASQFGDRFLGKVQNTVNTATQGQDQAEKTFTDQIYGANQIPSQDYVNQSIEHPENANAKQFQDYAKQSYKGPRTFADAGSIYNNYIGPINNAKYQAQQLGTTGGRQTLLDTYFGNAQYSNGEKGLDNYLIGKSGHENQINQIQEQGRNLVSNANNANQRLTNLASQRAGQVEASRNGINQALNDRLTSVHGQINDKLKRQNEERHREQNDLESYLTTGKVPSHYLEHLGIKEGTPLYNVDPAEYLHKNADLSLGQVENP